MAHESLERLCRIYWFPLYTFLRRKGHSPCDAQDLTQGFFAKLLEMGSLASVDPGKGRFRSFLLASLQHFVANERDRARALKRGGGNRVISMDACEAENRYSQEPVIDETPGTAFERSWVLALLDRVLSQLQEDYAATGREHLFEALKGALTGDPDGLAYREIGGRLGISEGAVKVAVHRLRARYRQILRDEIAQTVDGPGAVDEEIRYLFAVCS